MDWSLVLASQGIETTIDYAKDSASWSLLVTAADYDNAVNAIRQYRLENRGWPWRRELFASGLLFDAGSLAWAFLLILFYWLSYVRGGFTDAGIMDGKAVAHGEWWRLFTAIFLHADQAHLIANVTIGIVLIGLAMGRYGAGVGLLAAYLAGAGGNLASWLAYGEPHRGLGASGMIMGALGLLAVQSFTLWRKTPHSLNHIISGIAGGVMLFVLLGMTPGTDVVAHFGGFVTGLLLGGCLTLGLKFSQAAKANLVSGLCFALLTILTWWLALAN
jgi:rhomboid protease GluP